MSQIPLSPSLPDLQPVALADRVRSVDTLRGVALLGILAMNIIAFAYPSMAYMNPVAPDLVDYVGPFEGANKAAWWIAHVVFDVKMMSIFSMLFGAGLILMSERDARKASSLEVGGARRGFAGVYYRRLGWLLAIGLVHAYFIWWGDILVAYALCGMLLYPLRRLKPIWLIVIACVLFVVPLLIGTGFGLMMEYFRTEAQRLSELAAAGTVLNEKQQEIVEMQKGFSEGFGGSAAEITKTVAAMRGSWFDAFKVNALNAVMLQTIVFGMNTFWRALSMMLLGMAFMKLGIFSASRTRSFYLTLGLIGYAVGVPLVIAGALRLIDSGFDFARMYLINGHFNYVGSLFVALGHVSVVMLICQSGVLTHVRRCLAAVGQMALTNYLMQSIICTFIFNGWSGLGLGQFAQHERAEVFIVVGVVWALELIWSPLWLSKFQFGPAEWLWRSLTYAKMQPFRKVSI